MIYHGQFNSWNDVCNNFNINADDYPNICVIFAAYDCPSYEGSATVIFIQNGKIYIAGGSHCSCYGLEDQFVPDEVTIEMIRRMTTSGYGVLNEYQSEIEKMLKSLELIGIDETLPAKELEMALILAYGG